MNLEEIRREANKLGYYLAKKNPIPKITPCTCGCKRREHWFNSKAENITLICKKCRKSATGRTEVGAIINWNNMLKEGK